MTASMTYDEIKTAWDVKADKHNQWDSLGEDEKVEMSAFKVGDKIWSNVMGDGVVCMITLFPLNLMNARTFNDTQQKVSGMSMTKSQKSS